ncbi:hypothetical protein ASPZODRAFT_71574 [Penicilliopsis zonata CBS 506.65]|uniref:Pseudouridine synthase I TruA alpha/beta domain-containing protein n=1 Tax=Penicilliopsis zonata CBS 506.65 TaxID=1073090 RepID=A0A1L9SB14_9EURO|nr:hypothetical protein ASPZODRAFT_71574 [Penicilliopsis zonata CBS 506.65]OJJ44341.1 hypothetical protein ASPZODRAFT_71574 [Penicilliopsis zonata CBS 506.65]
MATQATLPSEKQSDYSTWSTSHLIARITELERQLHDRTTQFAALPANEVDQSVVLNPGNPPTETKATTSTETVPSLKPSKKRAHSPSDDFTQTRAPNRPPKEPRAIDPSKYNTRFIALKFAYLGQRYNGYEHANGNATPLPTIEEELWKALRRTHLILPTNVPDSQDIRYKGPRKQEPYAIDWEGCQYSKAGRTDRGVSAFGQVIGIRVRSARPVRPAKSDCSMESADDQMEDTWDDVRDELPYVSTLNRVLPEDIRVLAWCPNPPEGFDARFSCRERQYKYFFTNPAFTPTPGPFGFTRGSLQGPDANFREGWLDIDAMRKAAKCFEGVHDFRNFCKVDTSKQIENFERIIYRADIELVDPKLNTLRYTESQGFRFRESDEESDQKTDSVASPSPQVYTFTLHGSAFLWHQVRHMVSMLFLVGQGLESPTIVSDLLDISKNPCKPTYEMAYDAPLVLWDCIFPNEESGSREDALDWIYAGDPRLIRSQNGAKGNGKFGMGGIVDGLWSVWRQRKIDEVLAGELLDLAISQGDQTIRQDSASLEKITRTRKVFYGGDEPRVGGRYIPLMQMKKMETVEVQNAKYLAAKARRKPKE